MVAGIACALCMLALLATVKAARTRSRSLKDKTMRDHVRRLY